jgi:hypothetical protein
MLLMCMEWKFVVVGPGFYFHMGFPRVRSYEILRGNSSPQNSGRARERRVVENRGEVPKIVRHRPTTDDMISRTNPENAERPAPPHKWLLHGTAHASLIGYIEFE